MSLKNVDAIFIKYFVFAYVITYDNIINCRPSIELWVMGLVHQYILRAF